MSPALFFELLIAASLKRVLVFTGNAPYGTGANTNGEITGTGNKTTLTAMTGLPTGVTAAAVACGSNYSIIIGSDGVPYGTGYNGNGEITGTGNKTTLTAMTGLPTGVTAAAVACGDKFSIIIGSDGVPYGTGYNGNGEITGTGNKTTLTAMTGLPTGVTAAAVACGFYHSVIIGSNGTPYGTGSGGSGQITGTSSKTTLTAMTGLPTGVTAAAVACGVYHSIIIGSNGKPYGTGSNTNGEITGASTAKKTTLTAMTGLPTGVTAAAVACGAYHSAVIGSNGTPYGTGYNGFKALTGTGNKTTLTAMTGLPTGVTAVVVAGGYYHSAVIGSDRKPYGTGRNSEGEITGASVLDKSTLTAMTGMPAGVNAVAVAAGGNHTIVC